MLGLDLIIDGDGFRFRDPMTAEIPPDHVEAVAQRNRVAMARQDAEARVAELEELHASASAMASGVGMDMPLLMQAWHG